MKIENGRTLYNSFFVPTHFVVWVYDMQDMLIDSFSVRGMVMRHVSYWKIKKGCKEHLRDTARLEQIIILNDAAGDDEVDIVSLSYEFDPKLNEETVLTEALKSLYDETVNIEVKDFTKKR